MSLNPTTTREQAREMDRMAIEEFRVSAGELMENAGRACAATAREMLHEPKGRKALIVCGRGNNGGDGFVIARVMARYGAKVTIVILGSKKGLIAQRGAAAENLQHAIALKLPIVEALTAAAAVKAIAPACGRGLDR